MKLFALAAIVFFGLSVPAFAEWKNMDSQIEDTNVILGMDGQAFCSGTIISKKHRLVLTAAHCVNDAYSTKTVEIVDPKTGEISKRTVQTSQYLDVWQNKYDANYDVVSAAHVAAKPISRDQVTDVAILQIVDETWVPKQEAPFAKKNQVVRGEIVYIVGNPAGTFDGSVSKGIVSNPHRKLRVTGSDPTPYFQTDAAAIGGNSGGAVYNGDGELIGVLSAGMNQSTITFAIPLKSISALLVGAGFKEFE